MGPSRRRLPAHLECFALPRLAALIAAGLLLPFACWAPPAHANAEEFSSFDVEQQEEDDESLLDHILTRPPPEWRGEWERAPQAFRTLQGCLTSGQWFIFNDLKLRTALGRRSRFDVALRQNHDNVESFDYLGLSFGFPTRIGTTAVIFQPSYDKSRQDFSFMWGVGADTSALQMEVIFTIEDMLNNLWQFRQTRVGNAGEPYLRHPYVPELRVVSRHEHWRAEVGGRYLTPSRKQFQVYGASVPERFETLWGALGYVALEAEVLGLGLEATGTNKQATSTDQVADYSAADNRDFRRQWSTEVMVRRSLGPRLSAMAGWLYQARTQRYGAPLGPGAFDALDRLTEAELAWRMRETVRLRVGVLYDRITIAESGVVPVAGYGSRTERRAYVALSARFGRVSVEGIEGLELDHEPYEVVWIHDKGGLKLQTTF